MTSLSRRAVLGAATLVAAPLRAQSSPAALSPVRFAVSTYSFWHFQRQKYPVDRVLDDAARFGFDGVELLHRQMTDESPAYLNELKRRAFRNGTALVQFSIHQDFVSPNFDERQAAIRHTQYGIGMAERLGCPSVRINSGRWRTVANFRDLMAAKGIEPPLPGYTADDGLQWCIDGIKACIPAAEKAGVMLNLENHWGITTSIDNLLKIYQAVNSPWLGVNLDNGNFPDDPYPGIERLAPVASIVHAKTYLGGGEYYTLDLDYHRIARTLRNAKFNGWVSLEMEGKEPAETAVPKSLAILQAAFAGS